MCLLHYYNAAGRYRRLQAILYLRQTNYMQNRRYLAIDEPLVKCKDLSCKRAHGLLGFNDYEYLFGLCENWPLGFLSFLLLFLRLFFLVLNEKKGQGLHRFADKTLKMSGIGSLEHN